MICLNLSDGSTNSEISMDHAKAGSYYMAGNLFSKGISFLTIPIFTRMLSTSDYGIVTTYNSWVSILTMVIGCALHMSIRMAFIDYKDKIDDFLSTTITFTLENSLFLSALVISGTYFIKINLSFTLIVLCLLQGISGAIAEDYSIYLMMKFHYKARTALMILPNLISCVLSIIAVRFMVKEDAYMGKIIPTVFVFVVLGIILVNLTYRKSRVLHNIEYIQYGLKNSMPLVLHGIALNILSQSDRTMITWLADASQTGIYSLIYNFSMVATVITTSLDGVFIPWFMQRYYAGNLDVINRAIVDYIHLIECAMIGLILMGPEIVRLLVPETYWEGIIIIPPIVLSNFIIFLYTFFVNVEHYNKKSLFISINTMIAAASNLTLNYMFIPRFGYIAAAFTTLISYLIALVLHASYAKKLDRKFFPIKMLVPSLIKILVITVVFYLLIDMSLFRIIFLILFFIVSFYQNRKKLIDYVSSILNRTN